MVTRSMKRDVAYVHLNVVSLLMSVEDVYAQPIMDTRSHRLVNVFKNHEHQAVPVMMNVPTSNIVILNEELALMYAQRKHAALMHSVMEQTIGPFVNVSLITKEIQRSNAVSFFLSLFLNSNMKLLDLTMIFLNLTSIFVFFCI